LRNFHPFFIYSFREIYLETFLSLENVEGLIFTHNRTRSLKTKNSYSQPSLSSFLLHDYQSIMETHPDFYDPIGIQLERRFHKKKISGRILTTITLSNSTFNCFSPGKKLFLILIFERYTHVGIKMERWLQWKYRYT